MHKPTHRLLAIVALTLASTLIVPFALAQNYNVIGLVWNDTNCNGLQDTGEEGMANVQVALMHQGTDAVLYTGDDRLLEYSTSKTEGPAFLKGDIRYVRGSRLAPENYYLAIFNADKPAGYGPGPLQAGADRSIDNDLYLPQAAAGSPLWATVPFQLLGGQVTDIDIGLCAAGSGQPVVYDNVLYVPMALR